MTSLESTKTLFRKNLLSDVQLRTRTCEQLKYQKPKRRAAVSRRREPHLACHLHLRIIKILHPLYAVVPLKVPKVHLLRLHHVHRRNLRRLPIRVVPAVTVVASRSSPQGHSRCSHRRALRCPCARARIREDPPRDAATAAAQDPTHPPQSSIS